MLSSSVMQTLLLCIPISGEIVVMRHKPGVLFGSPVCKASFDDDASPASVELESATKIENRRRENSGSFIVALDDFHQRLASVLAHNDFSSSM